MKPKFNPNIVLSKSSNEILNHSDIVNNKSINLPSGTVGSGFGSLA